MSGLFDRLRDLGRETVRQLVRGPAGVLSLATLLLLLWQYYGYPDTFALHLADHVHLGSFDPIGSSLYWFATDVVALFCVPLLAAILVWKRKPRELGLGLGDWRLGLAATVIIVAAMIPIVVAVAPSADFRATYPLDPNALGSERLFWVYEAGYASFFIGWEFFFRGFLLFALEPWLGAAAIAVQMVPFALMHVGKPIAETLGSIIAGIGLGVLAWRTRSIWYCVAVHAAVALAMDFYVYFRWGTGSP